MTRHSYITGLVSVTAFCCTMLHASAAAMPSGVIAPQTTPQEQTALLQTQDGFIQIAQSVESSVVNIRSERVDNSDQSDDGSLIPLPLPPKAAPKGPDKAVPAPPDQIEATGSGVIVRSDGFILTNDHVVDGAINGSVIVTLSNGQQFPGKVYPDYQSDLAVIKIDPGTASLPVVTFANSSSVQPGQWAIAVGSPFDLQNTMTVGVISALHRQQTITGDTPDAVRYYPDLLQTDAPINPGNSGGPLFNMFGQVVGINVAIESPVEGSSGIGFAIPSNIAIPIMQSLITTGKVMRGMLGVVPEDLSPAMQQQYGVKQGAFLQDVVMTGPEGKPSPAAKAGLQAADIVTSYNGKPIDDELDFREAISATPPDTRVEIGYIRDGKAATTDATIEAAPPNPQNIISTPAPVKPVFAGLGLTVRSLTATDRTGLNLPPLTHGVLVTGAKPGSPADLAGLNQPDAAGKIVVQKINDTPVDTQAEFDQAAATLKPGSLVTLIILSTDDKELHQSVITIQL